MSTFHRVPAEPSALIIVGHGQAMRELCARLEHCGARIAAAPCVEDGLSMVNAKAGSAIFVADLRTSDLTVNAVVPRSTAVREPSPDDGRATLASGSYADELLGGSPEMRQVRELLLRAAGSDAPVLITGESGVGKVAAANVIHTLSARKNAPIVQVSCSAFAGEVLERELFGSAGHTTDSRSLARTGRAMEANGGTLAVSELSHAAPGVQYKLLEWLEARRIASVGAHKPPELDVRIIGTTNFDLRIAVRAGTFREDLFYRVAVASIYIPPLRVRRNDIAGLVDRFAQRFAAAARRQPPMFTERALRLLREQSWPGNAHQLRNFVERVMVMHDAARVDRVIVERELARFAEFKAEATDENAGDRGRGGAPTSLSTAVRAAERNAIVSALRSAGGNRSAAARMLGVTRRTLYNKVLGHAVGEQEFDEPRRK